jgi:NAD dependent epimerase/dehydratase family enzyme
MSGHPDCSRIVRVARQDKSGRADADVVTDANPANANRTDAEFDIVINVRGAAIRLTRLNADLLP